QRPQPDSSRASSAALKGSGLQVKTERYERKRETRIMSIAEKCFLSTKMGVSVLSSATISRLKDFFKSGGPDNVVLCKDKKTGFMQALKCKKKIPGQKISREVQILKQVKSLNQDENHIVSLAGFADLGDWTCIALQKLDMNLLELMAQRNFKPLKLYEIRPIARQMFMALSALKAIKVVHTNIKPENVMLIDHNLQPFEVKLTGFGNAQKTRKLSTTAIPKTCGYSAPETFLNGFQDETMDVWSLGCMLAFLVLGQDLLPPSRSEGSRFFTRSHKFKPIANYMTDTRKTALQDTSYDDVKCLIDLVMKKAPEIQNLDETRDFIQFLDLLQKMLKMNPADRILPNDALKHSFITMEHFDETHNSSNICMPSRTTADRKPVHGGQNWTDVVPFPGPSQKPGSSVHNM
uniref:Protein kinase domain-containing protein n=1 Tax=Nothobranchius furzeri TaxID=105023 RepID=A0A8C6P1X1_NOTFU